MFNQKHHVGVIIVKTLIWSMISEKNEYSKKECVQGIFSYYYFFNPN